MSGPVVVLAGGTGGAKLARGMLDVVGAELVVIANTGDDIRTTLGNAGDDIAAEADKMHEGVDRKV